MSQRTKKETASIRMAQFGTLGLIAIALVNAVLFYLHLTESGRQWPLDSFTTTASVVVLMTLHSVVPAIIVLRSIGRTQFNLNSSTDVREKLAAIFVTKIFVAITLLSVGAFIGWMGYCLSGDAFDLVVFALVVYCIAVDFPRTARVKEWIDEFQSAVLSNGANQ